jgi:outer membrane immunogenic protein
VTVRKHLPIAISIACIMATPAFAADQSVPWLPPLPESAAPPSTFGDQFGPLGLQSAGPMDWRGFYVGGEFDYSDAEADFSRSTQAPIAYSLRETALENEFAPSNWPVLGTADHTAPGFGGFVGYNTEYLTANAKIVLGVEANYDQASLSLVAPSTPMTRIMTDSLGNVDVVSITGSGQVSNLDFGTLRARAGWAVGNFLPYGFVGLALGRADVNIAETTVVEQNPPASGPCSASPTCAIFTLPGSAGKDGEWLYGVAVGAGLDVALTHNVFLRGEYEYVQFAPVVGVMLDINTVRVGGGIKF